MGRLTISSPITASQSVSPEGPSEGTELPSAHGTVTNTSRISREDLLGSVATTGSATDVVVNGNLAYVAGSQASTSSTSQNPADPVDKGTFGAARLLRVQSATPRWTRSAARTI